MAELNGIGHLVNHEKEDKTCYDNDGFYFDEKTKKNADVSDSDNASTENGHQSLASRENVVTVSLPNGFTIDTGNTHNKGLNGSAVVLVNSHENNHLENEAEEEEEDVNLNKDSMKELEKPLDTRLHHYVPLDEGGKMLNSDDTHIAIPEDAVVNFNTGRIRIQKHSNCASLQDSSKNFETSEKIPLENFTSPVYCEGSEKALEASQNGRTSEDQNFHANTQIDGNPLSKEKLQQSNGTGVNFDEYFIPANTHRKYLRGEKLYLSKDDRKLCKGWKRIIICGLIAIIIAVAILVGVLAATGILLAESENKNIRHASFGHQLPDQASMSHAGQTFSSYPSSKVPHKSQPFTTENVPVLSETMSTTYEVVSQLTPEVSSIVPFQYNDTSHSHTVVPNALLGEFTIDENFTSDLNDSTSHGYMSLEAYLQSELANLIYEAGGKFEMLKIISFRPGSIIVSFIAVWKNEQDLVLAKNAYNVMKHYLIIHNGTFLGFAVDNSTIKFKDIVDECRFQNGGCSFKCTFNYLTSAKICTCDTNMELDHDNKTCILKINHGTDSNPEFFYPSSAVEYSSNATTQEISFELNTTTSGVNTIFTTVLTSTSKLDLTHTTPPTTAVRVTDESLFFDIVNTNASETENYFETTTTDVLLNVNTTAPTVVSEYGVESTSKESVTHNHLHEHVNDYTTFINTEQSVSNIEVLHNENLTTQPYTESSGFTNTETFTTRGPDNISYSSISLENVHDTTDTPVYTDTSFTSVSEEISSNKSDDSTVSTNENFFDVYMSTTETSEITDAVSFSNVFTELNASSTHKQPVITTLSESTYSNENATTLGIVTEEIMKKNFNRTPEVRSFDNITYHLENQTYISVENYDNLTSLTNNETVPVTNTFILDSIENSTLLSSNDSFNLSTNSSHSDSEILLSPYPPENTELLTEVASTVNHTTNEFIFSSGVVYAQNVSDTLNQTTIFENETTTIKSTNTEAVSEHAVDSTDFVSPFEWILNNSTDNNEFITGILNISNPNNSFIPDNSFSTINYQDFNSTEDLSYLENINGTVKDFMPLNATEIQLGDEDSNSTFPNTFPDTNEAFSNETSTTLNESDVLSSTEILFGIDNSTENFTESSQSLNTSNTDESLLANGTFSEYDSLEDLTTLLPFELNETAIGLNSSDSFGNFSTLIGLDTMNSTWNETFQNETDGIKCSEDQLLCEETNQCLNNTFVCDGIQDCPSNKDEKNCDETCHMNFRCANSSMCIINEAHCDGIWDCENGTDEENCIPNECEKHEVMCLDGSRCIKPSDICDWKYDCEDRSDEVGCVERTTCELGGRFFCNDGLCIPWSLKCDGEYDCKDKEDEGNCTCLDDEFRCNDGRCLKSSSRCDGHADCYHAEDEMGCVNVDEQGVVNTYEPYSGSWSLLCAEDWSLDDGHYLCQELGFGHALSVERYHVSFNGTWMSMKRDNHTDKSRWTERVNFAESCNSNQAAAVECQKFDCGNYSGLLHRRKRQADNPSSLANQWPFIAYMSTIYSPKGCISEILTPIWIVTSAECLLSVGKEHQRESDWYVQTNVAEGLDSDLVQKHEVLKIIPHHHSSKFRSSILRDYDVALVRLKHALVFSDKIGAICLPEEQVPSGITCFSGILGTDKPRALPPEPFSISSLALMVMERDNCNEANHYNQKVNHRMLCTKSSDSQKICDNDEGTPLMCLSGPNNWYLAGMLTYQRFCSIYQWHPAVFSNLFAMRNFIDQVTGQKQYETAYSSDKYVILPPTTPGSTEPVTTTHISLPADRALEKIEATIMPDEFDTTLTESVEFSNFSDAINMSRDVNITELSVANETVSVLDVEDTTISYGVQNGTVDINESLFNESFEVSTSSFVENIPTYTIFDNDSFVQINPSSNNTHSFSALRQPSEFEINNKHFSEDFSPANFTMLPILHNITDEKMSNNTLLLVNDSDKTVVHPASNISWSDTTAPFLGYRSLPVTEDAPFTHKDDVSVAENPLLNTTENTHMIENQTHFQPSISNNYETQTIFNNSMDTEISSTIPSNLALNLSSYDTGSFSQKNSEIESTSIYSTSASFINKTESPIMIEGNTEVIITPELHENANISYENSDKLFNEFIIKNLTAGNSFANNEHMSVFHTNNSRTNLKNEVDGVPKTIITPSAEVIIPENDTSVNEPSPDTESLDILDEPDKHIQVETATAILEHAEVVETATAILEHAEVVETEPTVLDSAKGAILVLAGGEDIDIINTTAREDLNETTDVTELPSELYTTLISPLVENDGHNSSFFPVESCGNWSASSDYIKYNVVDYSNSFKLWPSLGFLQMVSEPRLCACSTLSSRYVLTSLSCLLFRDNHLNPENWAYLGGLNSTSEIPGTQYVNVEKIIPYPHRINSLLFAENDLALVKLKQSIKFNEYSKAVCVPEKPITSSTKCFTVGWSKSPAEADHGQEFYSVSVEAVATDVCNSTENYNGMLLNSLTCVTYLNERVNPCSIDVGAPLFCLSESNYWEIQGVLTFPTVCDIRQPAVYNSVLNIKSWLIEHLNNKMSPDV